MTQKSAVLKLQYVPKVGSVSEHYGVINPITGYSEPWLCIKEFVKLYSGKLDKTRLPSEPAALEHTAPKYIDIHVTIDSQYRKRGWHQARLVQLNYNAGFGYLVVDELIPSEKNLSIWLVLGEWLVTNGFKGHEVWFKIKKGKQ